MPSIRSALTAEIPVGHAEILRTERLGGDDPGAVPQVLEDGLEVVVHGGPEGEVVDEHEAGGGDLLPVLRLQEVALDQLVLAVLLAVPSHPAPEVLVQLL